MYCENIYPPNSPSPHQMSPSDIRYPSDGPDSLLCQTRRLPSFPHGSGEEAELKLAAAFSRLSAVLRRSVGHDRYGQIGAR